MPTVADVDGRGRRPRFRRLRRAVLGLGVGVALAAATLAAPAAAASPAPESTAEVPGSAVMPVKSRVVTVSQDGRTFRALLTEPAAERPLAYPVVAFGHGFLQSSGRYASTMTSLAARGYLVIAPDTQNGFLPNHSRLADDLWLSASWALRTQPTARPGVIAVAGHSMGGGAALLAAQRHPEIRAVATLAAAETRPSATSAAADVEVPALFVVGTRDSIVRPAVTRQMYDAKPAAATWAQIVGGYHCGFVDSSSFFGIGCDSGGISRSTQLGLTSQLLGEWLDNQLRGGPTPTVPPGVEVEKK